MFVQAIGVHYSTVSAIGVVQIVVVCVVSHEGWWCVSDHARVVLNLTILIVCNHQLLSRHRCSMVEKAQVGWQLRLCRLGNDRLGNDGLG